MIRLPDRPLPEATQSRLREWQKEIDNLADYALQVSTAKTKFASRNKAGNKTFASVKSVLTRMCSGARRCGYCEDSAADEVEHIRPKDLYPEHAFVWENYLYACGPCNGPKNNRFAVFSTATGSKVDLPRRPRSPVVRPETGDPLLIDPRREDPLQYMELDLLGTFFFLPTRGLTMKDRQRAEYTIELLRLNERDELLAARDEACRSYHARLVQYVKDKKAGRPQTHLEDLVQAVQRMGHPTVWKEIQRQHHLIPELSQLFADAPEAITW